VKSAPPAAKSDHPQWLRSGAGFVTIEIVARPGSQRLGLLRVEPRGLVIGIASPAEKGKANQELIATIADMAGVARGAVSILRGAGTRNKVVRIASVQPSEIARRLCAMLEGGSR
jgi:uncharacterized protein YggU (UPF0235/DUF167 family)